MLKNRIEQRKEGLSLIFFTLQKKQEVGISNDENIFIYTLLFI